MTSFILSIGMAMAVACGHDGDDLVRLFNKDVGVFATYKECRAAGIETQRGWRCRKETQ